MGSRAKSSNVTEDHFQLPSLEIDWRIFPDGTLVELIAGTNASEVALAIFDGKSTRVEERYVQDNNLYVPRALSPALRRAIRFPGPPRVCGPVRDLLSRIVEIVDSYVSLTARDLQLVAFWIISTWFADLLPSAASLLISSPFPAEAALLMWVFFATCRRGIQMGDLNRAGFCALPMDLTPTLLIDLLHVPRSMVNLLRVSNARGAHIAASREPFDPHCAKALFASRHHVDSTVAERMVQFH